MTTFVLIPGAGGEAWYWHRVVPLLEAAGYEAVAVDLPPASGDAGLAAYTDAVIEAMGATTDVVVVGQSMAGFTAPIVCSRVSARLLVLVNAMIPKPGETAGAWWGNTGQATAAAAKAEADGRDPDADFDVVEIFMHDVPDDVVAEAMARREPRQADRPFADPYPLDVWPAVPTRVISGADDRLFPADFQRRIAQERLRVTPDVIPGGHLVALSRPTELADQLLAYLR